MAGMTDLLVVGVHPRAMVMVQASGSKRALAAGGRRLVNRTRALGIPETNRGTLPRKIGIRHPKIGISRHQVTGAGALAANRTKAHGTLKQDPRRKIGILRPPPGSGLGIPVVNRRNDRGAIIRFPPP